MKLEGVEFILRENERLKKASRGDKGRIAALESEIAKVKGTKAPDNGAEGEESGKEAPKPHFTRSFEKLCPECGEENPDYVKPNLFCKGCNVPLGKVDKPEDAKKIPACWNCGGKEAVQKETPA